MLSSALCSGVWGEGCGYEIISEDGKDEDKRLEGAVVDRLRAIPGTLPDQCSEQWKIGSGMLMG